MRKWGEKSLAEYSTLDPRLQKVMDRVLQEVADISLLKGHRGQKEQNEAYYGDPQRSKLQWPNGKHNRLPSVAVDFQPYPKPEMSGKLRTSLAYIAGAAVVIGRQEGLVIRWGGDWDKDGSLLDQNFDDLFHLEIAGTIDEEDNNTVTDITSRLHDA